MAFAPISKAQIRVLTLLTKLPTFNCSYTQAGDILEAEGFVRSGIPVGSTWLKAKKLADTELLKALEINEPQDYSMDIDY